MKRRSLIISLVAIVTVAIGGVVATFVTDTTPQLGLDLQGGASVTLQPVGEADDESLTVVTDILRNRIDSLGVAEPEIIRQGNTVVVNLPGIKDQDRAIALVGQTGKVLFRPVQAETLSEEAVAAASTTTVPASTSTPPTSTVETSTSVAATSTTAGGRWVHDHDPGSRGPSADHPARRGHSRGHGGPARPGRHRAVHPRPRLRPR